MNLGIQLRLRDSGIYRILVVKCVQKFKKGTKHWHLWVFISIAAKVRWAQGSFGLSLVLGLELQGWLLEEHLFVRFGHSLALQVSLGSV